MEGCLKKPPCSGKRAPQAALVRLDGAEPYVLLYLKTSVVVLTSTSDQFHNEHTTEGLACDSQGMVRSEPSATDRLPAMKLARIIQSMHSEVSKILCGA